MIPWIHERLALAAAVLLAAAPAGAVPVVPPGTAYGVWRGFASCPLYWSPGASVAPVPHPAPGPVEPGRELVETSGAVALAEARGWIEVGRPEQALAALAAAPPADPRTRLYRLAALAQRGSWSELAAELDAVPASALPPACGALRSRWSAQAAAGSGDGAAAAAAWDELARARPALGEYVDVWRLEAAAVGGDLDRGRAAWARIAASGLPDEARDRGRAALAALNERGGRFGEARSLHLALAAESRG